MSQQRQKDTDKDRDKEKEKLDSGQRNTTRMVVKIMPDGHGLKGRGKIWMEGSPPDSDLWVFRHMSEPELQVECIMSSPQSTNGSTKAQATSSFKKKYFHDQLFLFLLLQLLFTLSLLSYWYLPSGSAQKPCHSVQVSPSSITPVLTILIWTWPFNEPVSIRELHCSVPWTKMVDCQITLNRTWYKKAHAVIIHHPDVSSNPSLQLPPAPRPVNQQWIWFTLESPSHLRNLAAMDGLFNLTMTYRIDSDIFAPYGWLKPRQRLKNNSFIRPPSPKTKLVAWVVSNWKESSSRVKYFRKLAPYLSVDIYGKYHKPLPVPKQQTVLSKYKFYLAFENSLHQDYITEKLWHNALKAWTVPIVYGPPRYNYERFLPSDAFIHVSDFRTPQELVAYLMKLNKDEERYLSYFQWRKHLEVVTRSGWHQEFCKACRILQDPPTYRTLPMLSKWFS
ncbi:3-galactosyl-N-acetylglucosaminide 4-alpha-L-fucosyltransferase FUT3-like [Dromiciops gliroides]|uniref:3-galactosyl-N-acetylglucosaminide 4-alpha-L-fucosyltransferase FUT3-like n=1 Tax=Dromiciops gliroides TaxID=33562 RepID=UPI001CC6258D|nr:3-galactosyl-N-acetylglucosaminide 4-alpha-L-fucosyltransferase FUT3-like [Dromiciops gliroides]